MTNMVLFAAVLVGGQIIGGFITMAIVMSKPFMKYYVKKTKYLMNEMQTLFAESFEEMD